MSDASDPAARTDLEYEFGRINAALDALAMLLDTADIPQRGEDIGALIGIVADRLNAARADLFYLYNGEAGSAQPSSPSVMGGFKPDLRDGVMGGFRPSNDAGVAPTRPNGGNR